MSLILAGIDEAGYGPTLGPLCVAMSAFEVAGWSPGDPAPDLWKLLRAAVCQDLSDKRGRIPIADSKRLKLANDSLERKKPVHPLVHLERGTLAMLQACADAHAPIATDHDLFSRLDAALPGAPWYTGEPTPLPLGSSPDQLAISAARLSAALDSAGVRFLGAWVAVIDEATFNDTVRRTGTKAEATAMGFGIHLRRLWNRWASLADPSQPRPALRLVCDQLGGRTQYGGLLARELQGVEVIDLAEAESRSRYALRDAASSTPHASHPDASRRDAIVQFMPEAESHHLPVAMASMAAKLTRELAMLRFNRYWCTRVPDLKPTAGYATDARRWLEEMRATLHPEERKGLVRIA